MLGWYLEMFSPFLVIAGFCLLLFFAIYILAYFDNKNKPKSKFLNKSYKEYTKDEKLFVFLLGIAIILSILLLVISVILQSHALINIVIYTSLAAWGGLITWANKIFSNKK